MAWSVPLPRRNLRSVIVFFIVILLPYVILKYLFAFYDRTYSISPLHHRPNPASKAGDVHQKPDLKQIKAKLERRAEEERKRRNKQVQQANQAKQAQKAFAVDHPGSDHEDEHESYDMALGLPDQRSQNRARIAKHNYLPNGLVEVNPNGQHPIFDLIERARRDWNLKLSASSRTLEDAITEYRRRYHRAPPKGFDRWWRYAEKNNIQLPDEYDQIYKDLEPFFAIPPSQLRQLRDKASTMSGMYTITCPGHKTTEERCTASIVEEGLNEEGRTVARQRADAQLSLLHDIQAELEPIDAVYSSHDGPWQFIGHEYKGALEDAAALAECGSFLISMRPDLHRSYADDLPDLNIDEHDLDDAHLGWASACAPHKPLREEYDPDELPDLDDMWQQQKSFIWNHKTAMDPCEHPEITHLVGFLSGFGKGPRPSKELYPVMAMSKTELHSDIVAISMEAWVEDVDNDPPWESKSNNKMLWRGKTTGIYFKDDVPWNISQRANLVKHTNKKEGVMPLLHEHKRLKPVGQPDHFRVSELNEVLMDVAFVDEPIQCDQKVCQEMQEVFTFGDRKDWAQGNQYKYLLDLDGNGWSARFKRLMTSNSVVLKSTIFPEWYSDRIQPWLHYVPIKADLTDLYDVMAFFRKGNDKLAKNIALEGKSWSKTFWRKEDMISYQFRLYLELARLMAADRDDASHI